MNKVLKYTYRNHSLWWNFAESSIASIVYKGTVRVLFTVNWDDNLIPGIEYITSRED